MVRLAYICVATASFLPLFCQANAVSRCLPNAEFAPMIIENPDHVVTFRCEDASSRDLIRAVGFQTRIPIGVVLGEDLDKLSRTKHSFDLERVDAKAALLAAIDGTEYSIKDENGVIVLVAGDLAPYQRALLAHRFTDFPPQTSDTMVSLGVTLTIWLRAVVDPTAGSGASILGSTNEEHLTLKVAPVATTEDIANQIVSLGSKGMWVFRVGASPLSGVSAVDVDIEPYQHYTNEAAARR